MDLGNLGNKLINEISKTMENNKNINQKNGGNDTGSSIVVNEVVEGLKKYQSATFPMPFENWNSEKDVVTSKFSNNRTIIVNGQLQSRAHTGIDLVVISISEITLPIVAAVRHTASSLKP